MRKIVLAGTLAHQRCLHASPVAILECTCNHRAIMIAPRAHIDDFAPCAEADLDAHTTAIETLSATFDNLTAAFTALKYADNLYATAAALYEEICDTYTFAVTAYDEAAVCAMCAASEGNLQAVKDNWQILRLEDRAATAVNPVTAKAEIVALKTKAAEDAAKARGLESKARAAETKAKEFINKANIAKAIAQAALLDNQIEGDELEGLKETGDEGYQRTNEKLDR